MNSEPKREWVFDGTRGEFWTFLIVAAVYFVLFIQRLVHAVHRVVPNTRVDSSMKYSMEEFFVLAIAFVGFFILAIMFRVFGKWFTVAFSVKAAETAVRILFGYRHVTGTYAIGILAVLDYLSTLLLFIAFLSYIVTRLRREPLSNTTESNPV